MMEKVRAKKASDSKGPLRPALSIESRENQLIALAVDEAEKQLREGTASSQIITHFLKLGTTMAQLEKVKLEKENELLNAKTEALKSAKKMEDLYEKAIKAMASYSGHGDVDEDY